jgi:hypothetical protein
MARPNKHNAEYFSHDNSMRNDLKIKALRRKYSHKGYSIFNMMLELLTENDYFEIEWSEINIELLTPDFDIDADELNEIINYCIKLNLLQLTNGYLHCNKLTDRLEDDVLSRRKGYCSNNAKRMKLMLQQPNINVVNVYNNDDIDNINGQSKVKESKVNKIEVKESKVNKNIVNKLLDELFIADGKDNIMNVLEDMKDIGLSNICTALNYDERQKENLENLIEQKLNSITE